MKTVIALESLSALKRTVQAQIAATKSFPKTAALIRKLKEKIKLLKKQALKTYLKRRKDDAVKEAHKKSEHKTAKPAVHKTGAAKPAVNKMPKPKKAHSSSLVVLSAGVEDRMLDRETNISDEDLAECCTLESTSAVSVQTKGEKKKESQQLKKSTKNPKAALRKKQMSAAMRIRENKKLRIEIKKLLEMKKKLQDKAWGLYVAKMKGKKSAGKPADSKKPAGKTDSKDAFTRKSGKLHNELAKHLEQTPYGTKVKKGHEAEHKKVLDAQLKLMQAEQKKRKIASPLVAETGFEKEHIDVVKDRASGDYHPNVKHAAQEELANREKAGKKSAKPAEKKVAKPAEKAAKPATTGHPDIKSKEAKALVENAAKGKFDFNSAQKMESGDEKNAVFEEMQKHVKGENNVGKHKKHLADALKKHGMSEKDYAQFLKDKHDNDKEFFSVHTRGPKDETLVRAGAEKQQAAWAKKEKALKNHPGAAVGKELSKHKTYLGTHLQDWSDPSKGLEHR